MPPPLFLKLGFREFVSSLASLAILFSTIDAHYVSNSQSVATKARRKRVSLEAFLSICAGRAGFTQFQCQYVEDEHRIAHFGGWRLQQR